MSIANNTRTKTTLGTVLVIDDDQDSRNIISLTLRNNLYDVLTASGAEEGLNLANKINADLIVLDIYMPGINGLDLLTKLRKNPKVKNIPILMLTAVDATEAIRMAIDRGASDYLVKPLDFRSFIKKVNQLSGSSASS